MSGGDDVLRTDQSSAAHVVVHSPLGVFHLRGKDLNYDEKKETLNGGEKKLCMNCIYANWVQMYRIFKILSSYIM